MAGKSVGFEPHVCTKSNFFPSLFGDDSLCALKDCFIRNNYCIGSDAPYIKVGYGRFIYVVL